MKKILLSLTATSMLLTAPSAYAGNDFVGGVIGSMIGTAIIQSQQGKTRTTQSRSSGISSAQRAENKEIQTNLNYFGFNTGTPDGIFGKKTAAAISMYQSCLSRPVTGTLDSFEKSFLNDSAMKAQMNPTETLRLEATLPNGKCGILQKYFIDLTTPAQQQVEIQTYVQEVPTGNVAVTNVVVIEESVQSQYDRYFEQWVLLDQIRKHIELKINSYEDEKKLRSIINRLTYLKAEITRIEEAVYHEYGVPIKPTNDNLGITAVKASEVFPRVPYYIPGTNETGELWIKPEVTDVGELQFQFNFVSLQTNRDDIVENITMTTQNVLNMSKAMVDINRWSDTAQEKKLRRIFDKRAHCFPANMCEEKRVGNSSTEFVFMLYDDGSTAAAIRRNKGKYSSTYNLSIESGLLLAAYADYVVEVGLTDYKMNSMTDEELGDLFD